MDENILTIHTDGGSRGNPGNAASAFVIHDNNKEIYKESKYLGRNTNNNAEYMGVVMAVEWLEKYIKNNRVDKVNFVLDSELVVKQINGLYKVKHPDMLKLHTLVKRKIGEMGIKTAFLHVLRKDNKLADQLVNEALDNYLQNPV